MNAGDNPDRLVAVTPPDFDAYAEGRIDASQVQCLMCGHTPCMGRVSNGCPEFGSPEYMARLDQIHGRTTR